MRNKRLYFLYLLSWVCLSLWAQAEPAVSPTRLAGFVESPYLGEQIRVFDYDPGIKVHINAPSAATFDARKPTRLMIFALPNTNRTHWCIGKQQVEGDDPRFQVLHIGGQTRYIRSLDKEHNFVTIYLEADTRAWGRWRRGGEGRDLIIRKLVQHLYDLFSAYQPQIELNGHSGGGSFIFGFIEAGEHIPSYVQRISFIDSNYNWNRRKHAHKLGEWLDASPSHCLSVIAYDDGNALLATGKPVIDRKDGTGYRTKLMMRWARRRLTGIKWQRRETDSIIELRATRRPQLYFFYRKNPERKIYHAPLGELNGYIQSALSNTPYEGVGYRLMEERAYEEYIAPETYVPDGRDQ